MSDTDRTADSGEITVTVRTPDGIPAPAKITVTYEPETTAEFERIVEVLGGSLAFLTVTDFAFTHLPDGALVCVFQPKDAEKPKPEPLPFMRAFQRRIDDTKAFQARLERAA